MLTNSLLSEAHDDYDPDLASQIEAILITASEPCPTEKIAELCEVDNETVERHIDSLSHFYDQTYRGFFLRKIAGGWQYASRDHHGDLISRWVVKADRNKLSQAAMETLAIIAYAQPITRGRISAIRGVNVDGVVRTLISRGLVEQVGADGTAGSMLKTTDLFLIRAGLSSLDDLPPIAPHLPEADELADQLAKIVHSD